MGINRKRKKHLIAVVAVLIVIIVVLVIGCLYLLSRTSVKVTSAAEEAYQKTLVDVSEKTAQEYYDWAFQKSEENYHVSNRVSISIGDIEEQSKLEVLKVSDVEFIVHNDDGTDEDARIWVAVPGNGVFTVDLTVSEFLIDNKRHIVIARISKPRLTQCGIDKENIEIYELETGGFGNGNYLQGENLAEEDLKEGERMIREEFNSNQVYLSMAEKSAETFISDFIMNLNPDVEDLKVEVEFVD